MKNKIDTSKFEAEFLSLVSQDTETAIEVITGMFVGITLEYLRRRGQDVDVNIIIKGGYSRDITIHAPNTDKTQPLTEPDHE